MHTLKVELSFVNLKDLDATLMAVGGRDLEESGTGLSKSYAISGELVMAALIWSSYAPSANYTHNSVQVREMNVCGGLSHAAVPVAMFPKACWHRESTPAGKTGRRRRSEGLTSRLLA